MEYLRPETERKAIEACIEMFDTEMAADRIDRYITDMVKVLQQQIIAEGVCPHYRVVRTYDAGLCLFNDWDTCTCKGKPNQLNIT